MGVEQRDELGQVRHQLVAEHCGTVPAREILDVRVDLTVVGGRLVYRRGGAP